VLADQWVGVMQQAVKDSLISVENWSDYTAQRNFCWRWCQHRQGL